MENMEPNTIIIIPSSDDEQQIHNDDPQEEALRVFLGMVLITAIVICAHWCKLAVQSNSGTQLIQRSGSEADNVTNELPSNNLIPATGRQSSPELNEEPNIGANVGSRPNSGGELHVVSQPQNFSSDTDLITVAENFGLSDLAASRQGVDGVNNEILNSVDNRARNFSEIEDSQLDQARRTQKRIRLHPQNHSSVHDSTVRMLDLQ
ncbi:hypothetical protein CLIB1444_06S07470 [[Candida] jaroonii]|uniref:Uncharacterized protein n=1 Tax=[Candida] jaroonii TaxID=467808 RepID=A0ACA9YA11_9ASCO|nr:hypothetical protein CLIB1444_06S07470 [[Candida] jaroonii]